MPLSEEERLKIREIAEKRALEAIRIAYEKSKSKSKSSSEKSEEEMRGDIWPFEGPCCSTTTSF